MKLLLLYTHNKSFLSKFYEELSAHFTSLDWDITIFSLKREQADFYIDNLHFVIKIKGDIITNYGHIYSIIKKKQPDIIISNFSYVNPALLFGKLFGIKHNVAWIHTLSDQINPDKKQIFIKRQFLKLADLIVVNSIYLKEDLSTRFHVSESKLKAIPFWSTLNEFKSEPLNNIERNSNFKIGCPGRLVSDKNQAIIVSAISKLDGDKEAYLYLAGEGTNKKNLEKLVATYHLETQVEFLGALSSETMLGFYHAMDVIILPSLHESFGLVFIEALSQGVPVLVSSAFGALTFIDPNYEGLSDLIFDPTDSMALKQKIEALMHDGGKPKQYYFNLYDKFFDKHKIVNQLKQLLIT